MARPRKYTKAKREPNGRVSRSKSAFNPDQQEAMAVVLEARERLYGLSRDQAIDQLAGSFIGRLCLASRQQGGKSEYGIDRIQYDALKMYEQSARAFQATMGGPKSDTAFDPNRVTGLGMEPSDEYQAKVRRRHASAIAAVQERQRELRRWGALMAALYDCVERDREIFGMVGDLREAANALAIHYGLVSGRPSHRIDTTSQIMENVSNS